MKTLKVILKQHTPLIHFQHDQYGATLRASEVKPKLDKFILERLGNGNYEDGVRLANEKQWLVGKGEHPALDYKMRIIVGDEIDEMKLRTISRNDGKFTTELFPLLLANMGKRSRQDELVNFTMYQMNNLQLSTICKSLYEILKTDIPYFFAVSNFGQRSGKGFGSYTVSRIDDVKIFSLGFHPYYIPKKTLYMEFNIETSNSLKLQKCIFGVVEAFWKGLKKYFKNKSKRTDFVRIYLGKIIDGIEIQRIPSPLVFKPIVIENNRLRKIKIFIYPNKGLIDSFPNKESIICGINNLIDSYIDDIMDPDTGIWNITLPTYKSIDVEFYDHIE